MAKPLDKGVHLKCAHTDGHGALTYASDGSEIVTCGADNLVKIFDINNFAAEPRNVEYHDSPVTTIAVNSKVRAIAARAAQAGVIDVRPCALAGHLRRHRHRVWHGGVL
jgi:WD40 repeat protein